MNATIAPPKAWFEEVKGRNGGGRCVVVPSTWRGIVTHSRLEILSTGDYRAITIAPDHTYEQLVDIADALVHYTPDLDAVAASVGCSADQVAEVLRWLATETPNRRAEILAHVSR